MPWTIKGTSATTPATVGGVVHGLDVTARTFDELNLSAAKLEFQSLAMDTLRWTAGTTNARGAGTIVPEIGQVVELLLDGVRKFRGHAVSPRIGMTSLAVEVVGPWWWMQEIQLTDDRTDDDGGIEERVQFRFPAGDLGDMIKGLIDRMIALGVPIARGPVAAMGPVTQVTLNNMSCANALTALMSRCPDAVAYFDYEPFPPKLKIARRNGADAMPDLGFEVGVDAVTLDGQGLNPRQDLKISWLRVNYMGRHATTKRAQYKRQTSSGARVAGEWIIQTTAGPEIVQTLPIDEGESMKLQTSSGASDNYVASHDDELSILLREYGINGEVRDSLKVYYDAGSTRYSKTISFAPFRVADTAGSTSKPIGKLYVINDTQMPDWAVKQFNAIPVIISGTWVGYEDRAGSAQWSTAFENWRQGAWQTGYGLAASTGTLFRYYYARKFSVQAWMIDDAFPIKTVVYKNPKYTFETPPAGMANFLREAQNWTPWEGSFEIVADEMTGANLLGRAINLAGTHKDCDTMRTTAKSLAYDLMRKRQIWTLGAPARIDFKTAVGRIQTSPPDNIIQLGHRTTISRWCG